jgi:hypothetical protein
MPMAHLNLLRRHPKDIAGTDADKWGIGGEPADVPRAVEISARRASGG